MTIKEAMEGMNITNEYDYRIGFINADGQHDETELSADNNEDLERTYEEFCEDNGFSKDTVKYIESVEREENNMNDKLKELYDLVVDVLKDAPNEDECTDEENEVYAECQNLKEAIEALN